MAIHNLTNVPTRASGVEIRAVVEGEEVKIVACDPRSPDGHHHVMTSTWVGSHMFGAPEDLRAMYARDLAAVIAMARDAGYAQAQADMRRALGISRL